MISSSIIELLFTHTHTHTHTEPIEVLPTCMCICLGLNTWNWIPDQGAHPWRGLIFFLPEAMVIVFHLDGCGGENETGHNSLMSEYSVPGCGTIWEGLAGMAFLEEGFHWE